MTGARIKRPIPDDAPVAVALILSVRRARHWTQSQLARELGVHLNTVKRWERGEHEIHQSWLKLVSALLDPP